MIDLPAGWQETAQQIDWFAVQDKVKDYGPVLRIIQETWDRESLLAISRGKLFVPDDVVNQALARHSASDGPIRSVTIASHADGRMDIHADTCRVGMVELSGTLQEFVHKGDQSYMTYRVRERNLPSHGLMSWIFSRVSLSMASRLVGNLDFSGDLPMKIHHNTIWVDYSKVLEASDLGQTEFRGHRLSDMIEITGVVPKDGGLEFSTQLNVPDDVKEALLQIVQ